MSGVLSLIGWTFLPNLATNWVQSIYYGITIRAGDPKPQPGTARYAEHRRRIHILVVSLYLLYTIYEADYDLRRQGSFYTVLSLGPDATDREVKSRFRRLAALYHPDKVGTGSASSQSPVSAEDASAYFIRLKTAAETLGDAARRFAYDRLGPDVVSWTRCVTVRDYVMQGLQNMVPFYGGAGVFMWLLGYLGYLEWGRTWRWLTFLGVMLFEVHVIMRPYRPVVLDKIINPALSRVPLPPYLPFQAVSLARKVSVTLYVAFSQIGPLLGADTSSGRVVLELKGEKQEAMLDQALQRLEFTSNMINQDTANLLEMELVPFSDDPASLSDIQGKVKEWLVQNTIRSDPMVRDALGNSLRTRRVNAPSGARGTK